MPTTFRSEPPAPIIAKLSAGTNDPLSVKLRIKSWAQLRHLYDRDIKNNQLFLKSSKAPPLGTKFQINLSLPSDSTLSLFGRVDKYVEAGALEGRGPGVLLRLDSLPYTAQWLIESSLTAAAKSGSLPASAAPGKEASVDEGRDEVAAEQELVDSMQKELDALRDLNAFQILDLEYTATTQDVRKSFAQLTKKYHPDRFAKFKSDAARLVGSEIYLRLRDAYQVLKTDAAREKLLAKLGGLANDTGPRPAITVEGTAPPPTPKAARPAAAPPPIPKPPAPKAKAEPARGPASGPNVIDGRFAKLLSESKYDEALKLARVDAMRHPGDRQAKARVEVCEGLRSMAQGDRMEAAERFEATLELDPDNEHAIRAVAEIRRRATEDRKGFLGRLLTKRD